MARLRNGKLVDGRWHSGKGIQAVASGGRRAVQIGKGGVVRNIYQKRNYSPANRADHQDNASAL
jgi:hypothetical protein